MGLGMMQLVVVGAALLQYVRRKHQQVNTGLLIIYLYP